VRGANFKDPARRGNRKGASATKSDPAFGPLAKFSHLYISSGRAFFRNPRSRSFGAARPRRTRSGGPASGHCVPADFRAPCPAARCAGQFTKLGFSSRLSELTVDRFPNWSGKNEHTPN